MISSYVCLADDGPKWMTMDGELINSTTIFMYRCPHSYSPLPHPTHRRGGGRATRGRELGSGGGEGGTVGVDPAADAAAGPHAAQGGEAGESARSSAEQCVCGGGGWERGRTVQWNIIYQPTHAFPKHNTSPSSPHPLIYIHHYPPTNLQITPPPNNQKNSSGGKTRRGSSCCAALKQQPQFLPPLFGSYYHSSHPPLFILQPIPNRSGGKTRRGCSRCGTCAWRSSPCGPPGPSRGRWRTGRRRRRCVLCMHVYMWVCMCVILSVCGWVYVCVCKPVPARLIGRRLHVFF